jgi:phage baseplate assembly protein W
MAYRIENSNPLDLDYKLSIGVSIPFVGSVISGSDAVFSSTYTTTEQLRSDIINYILTNKGERILNPNYGSDLRRFVFENINGVNLNNLKSQITDGLKANFPQIIVNNVTITPDHDINSININIDYSFAGGKNSIDITL